MVQCRSVRRELSGKGSTMKKIVLAILFTFGTASAALAEDAAPPKRILFFTKSQRTEHSVIKRAGDEPSFAEKVLFGLAAKNGWEITTTKDGTVFTAQNLARYDALLFYTNG